MATSNTLNTAAYEEEAKRVFATYTDALTREEAEDRVKRYPDMTVVAEELEIVNGNLIYYVQKTWSGESGGHPQSLPLMEEWEVEELKAEARHRAYTALRRVGPRSEAYPAISVLHLMPVHVVATGLYVALGVVLTA